MAKKTWLENINPFSKMREREEIKSLQNQIDVVVGEFEDTSSYVAKWADAEASGGNSGATIDMSGVEQQIDIAALQRIYATETWVYNAISTIAETVSALPWKLEKSKVVPKKIVNQITGAEETINEKVWTDASGEPLFEAFEYPNRYTTRTELLSLMIIDLMSAGEAYIYLDAAEGVDLMTIEGDLTDNRPDSPFGRLRSTMAAKRPIDGMYRIPPAIIRPVLSEDKRKVEGYAMQTADGSFAFNAAEIIHIKLPNPLDQFRGLSPLMPAFKPILMDRFTTEHMIRFYKSGARLGGVIETDKSLNKEQLGRFQRSFENNYTGRQNHHRTLILPPGMKYNMVEQNPAETALLEFCRYNRESILATFKVPPIKMGITDGASYANAYAQLKTYYNDCIKPKLGLIQDGFNLKSALMPDNRSFRIQFDLSNVEELKEDLKTTAETGKFMIESGVTINEVRQKLWKLGPIKQGEKSPVVERMSKPGGLFSNLSAEPGETKEVNGELTKPTDAKPTTGTFTDRVNELVGQYVQSGIPLSLAVPKAIAQAQGEGFTDAPDDAAKDLTTADNSALIQVDIGRGKPKGPCDKCKKDPCVCPPPKKTLAEFISENLAKLADGEVADAALITELVSIYNAQNGIAGDAKESLPIETHSAITVQALADSTAPAVDVFPDEAFPSAQIARFSIRKETAIEHWKSTVSKSAPLIEKRANEVRKFFKEFQSVVLNRFGGNIKAYGIHKARDNDDIDDILDLEGYQEVIKNFTKEVDAALLDAYKLGFDTTLAKFDFKPRNEDALEYLKQYAASDVKYITETTRDQMREVLSEAFDAGMSVGDVSKSIRAKFDEINQGRAVTIARTETLSAVSAGREAKRADFKEQFPDKKLKKQWVSSQDDRVRDSHSNVDGEVVDADEQFSNGLLYPRDPDGDAEEVINCRCDDMTFAEEDQDVIAATMAPDEEQNNES